MKPLIPLADNHKDLYELCIQASGVRAQKQLLRGLKNRVVSCGVAYEAAFSNDQSHTLSPLPVTGAEKHVLSNLYDYRMVKKNGVCRDIYNQIKLLAGKCPLCGFGEVYEVDHFLPQALMPEYNILPKNLLPVCHPCNHKKLDSTPQNAGQYFLHPYFDQLPDERWLFAEITIENNGPILQYYVDLDENIYGTLAQRLKYHFDELELSERMKNVSATILTDLEADISEHLLILGPNDMQRHFEDEGVHSFRRHGNTMETAAYFAASENEDYYSGSYRS